VVEAAGCGLELQSYPATIADRVRDASVLLDSLPLPQPSPVPLRVALHDACHARHGQGISDEPRRLLRDLPGLSLQEPAEPDVCCGSGGVFSIAHPELSERMGQRKATLLAATGADLVVTTNPGCLGQIIDGLALVAPGMPILPLTDLLWYAYCRP
jgi:glycolate oxidase iron-sulfur subunit